VAVTAQSSSRRALIESAPNVTPPAGNPRFPLFDSLRAIAALTVLVGHSMTITQAVDDRSFAKYAPQLASQGVAIFFLISGFLLYRPFVAARLAGRDYRVRDYARRRFLRIVPAYWVALTVIVIYFGTFVTWGNAWRFYGFGQIYSNKTFALGLGPAWTLCVEVTFYAALPLLALAAARLARPQSLRVDAILIAVLAVLSVGVYAIFYDSAGPKWIAGSLPALFYWFALGMALALLSIAEQWRPGGSRLAKAVTRWPTAFWVAGVGFFVLLCAVRGDPNAIVGAPVEYLLYGLVALCVLLPAVFGDGAPGYARTVLRWRVLSWIGLVSYAVYLYHAYVILWLSRRAEDHHIGHRYLFVLALAVPLTCLIAAASYYILERPILQLKNLPLRAVVRGELMRIRKLVR
jgi:peptidoglycan/LPS O-acetylase OafA/YrhL